MFTMLRGVAYIPAFWTFFSCLRLTSVDYAFLSSWNPFCVCYEENISYQELGKKLFRIRAFTFNQMFKSYIKFLAYWPFFTVLVVSFLVENIEKHFQMYCLQYFFPRCRQTFLHLNVYGRNSCYVKGRRANVETLL